MWKMTPGTDWVYEIVKFVWISKTLFISDNIVKIICVSDGWVWGWWELQTAVVSIMVGKETPPQAVFPSKKLLSGLSCKWYCHVNFPPPRCQVNSHSLNQTPGWLARLMNLFKSWWRWRCECLRNFTFLFINAALFWIIKA